MPVNSRWAAPWPSLADLESLSQGRAAAEGATVSPSLDSTGKKCFVTNLSFQGPSLAEPTWTSSKFKSIMSGPVTSWSEQGAGRDPHWTSDTS
jgi:hypothetical protein